MEVPAAAADFSEFYRAEFARLVRSLRPFAGANAEDIAQDAFIVAQQRWSDVAALDVPFAWIRRVGIRIANRRSQRDQMRAVLEAGVSNMHILAGRDLDLVAAMAQLPDRQAAAVWLHHMEDQPVAEVADRLDCTLSAAKVLLHRSRRRLSERVGGLSGVWVSEQLWSPDAIARYLHEISAAEHIGPVLDDDLGGRGGRWELTLVDGSYEVRRSDGLRLDLGSFHIRGRGQIELVPAIATGHVVFVADVDGDQLRMRQVENTTPPTRGVPDSVWMSLFLGSGVLQYSGRPLRKV